LSANRCPISVEDGSPSLISVSQDSRNASKLTTSLIYHSPNALLLDDQLKWRRSSVTHRAAPPAPVLPNHGGFPKTAFRLDLEAAGGPSCACPGGHTTAMLAPCGKGRQVFVFPVAVCAACPFRAQCLTESNGQTTPRTGRTILLHPQEALLQAARAFQCSPAFAEVRRRRQAAEHRLARLVQLGSRQSRSVGRAKTLFQLALAATVANLTLLAG